MYTNLKNHGGLFNVVLDKEFSKAKNVSIATGYTSLDILNSYENSFMRIAKQGGISKLLLGMAFYEGLSSRKLDFVNNLNLKLKEINHDSGVFVTNGRRYHGKVYCFEHESNINIYLGSSNFSTSGTKGNIECTVPIQDKNQKNKVLNFLEDLYSPTYSISIDRAEITVPGKKKVVLKNVENVWNSIENYNPNSVDTSNLPRFEFSLERVVEKEKSNLNVYFGKGRLNTNTGKITPRPWYEIELIANNEINSNPFYPKGDFLAYTDDGYIIPMRTQGDYYKNIRSKQSLQIFGIWLKGKLEKSGALAKYQPVTLDTLVEYGNSKIDFFKIDEGKYFIKF
ncbi:MAG: NgoFVII family restriction endonuclease [Bacteroidales bacterium]|nr:NgoFVII family restriction endonuclease [Bacteroidales bacterium]